ncbi:hypothetical protein SNEBB_009566 [Seison nebaliae]|nr:hypothetical protein SNEBB_009566 [Seison nebaliae]
MIREIIFFLMTFLMFERNDADNNCRMVFFDTEKSHKEAMKSCRSKGLFLMEDDLAQPTIPNSNLVYLGYTKYRNTCNGNVGLISTLCWKKSSSNGNHVPLYYDQGQISESQGFHHNKKFICESIQISRNFIKKKLTDYGNGILDEMVREDVESESTQLCANKCAHITSSVCYGFRFYDLTCRLLVYRYQVDYDAAQHDNIAKNFLPSEKNKYYYMRDDVCSDCSKP